MSCFTISLAGAETAILGCASTSASGARNKMVWMLFILTEARVAGAGTQSSRHPFNHGSTRMYTDADNKYLPQESARNTKIKGCFSALFAFFCGYHVWFRLCLPEA